MNFLINVLAFLNYLLLKLYFKTLRVEFVNQELYQPGKTLIGFWHQDMLMALRISLKSKGVIITVDTWTGKVFKRVCELFGFTVFEISRKSHAIKTAKAIKSFIKVLNTGQDGGIALDGFEPPAFVDKGVKKIILESTQHQYVFLKVEYRHRLPISWRWDQITVPLFFVKVCFLKNS